MLARMGLPVEAPLELLGKEQSAAAYEFTGQLLFATEALKRECGVRCDGDEAAFAERLMVDTADISGAFWATKWGAAMRDELDRAPFDPCADQDPKTAAAKP